VAVSFVDLDYLSPSSLNSDGQQFPQHQQNEQPPITLAYWTQHKIMTYVWTHHCLNFLFMFFVQWFKEEEVVGFVDLGGIVDHHCLYFLLMFFVQWFKGEVVVNFVDLGGIVDHHCLNFLFMFIKWIGFTLILSNVRFEHESNFIYFISYIFLFIFLLHLYFLFVILHLEMDTSHILHNPDTMV
jgi:hypothetical protein